ncbi:MAG TPA: hypothetical protein VML19_03330 [Verrucomicrobiae bacterium]|nr:hypothetical protein [Verrucomicrobiae bacterium]
MTGSETPTTSVAVNHDECRALVGRITTTRDFRRATRLREFLIYVVDRHLAGHDEEITEPLIGQRVFGRPKTYNPGDDSIVRTEARTVRQRLDRYFAEEGAGEPMILEIPRGRYVPVFRARPATVVSEAAPSDAEPPSGMSRRWLAVGGLTALAGAVLWRSRPDAHPVKSTAFSRPPVAGQVVFECSEERLQLAFQNAHNRALSCVYTGDPVGDWYATMPAGQSDVFCMRDVSHQSVGASVLGLTHHTANMLRAFAQSTTQSRDWCGYWVITKDGFPAPSNYSGDSDFGFGLPANFDVMRACYRQLLWTGDPGYLNEAFSTFYSRTVSSYVDVWDPEHDGIMQSNTRRRRVHGSYHSSGPRLATGVDLVAAQYAGYQTYAAIQDFRGREGSLSQKIARDYRQKAHAFRERINHEWWNGEQDRFFSGKLADQSWDPEFVAECNMYALWFGLPEDGPKGARALDELVRTPPVEPRARSYTPEVLYEFGRNEQAYQALLEVGNPEFFGHEVASEPSFAVVGAVATGLMGIAPNVPKTTLQTRPRLSAGLSWAKLSHIPVGPNVVSVEHRDSRETVFTNESGPPLQWKATFDSRSSARLIVDGASLAPMVEEDAHGQPIASTLVPVNPGQTRTARWL